MKVRAHVNKIFTVQIAFATQLIENEQSDIDEFAEEQISEN